MKNIKFIFFLFSLCILTISYSCTDDSNEKTLTVEMFVNSLERNMSYDQLVDLFGEPNRDEGSGIHIYIWILEDGTEVGIGYDGVYVRYAYHCDKEANIIKTIIEPGK